MIYSTNPFHTPEPLYVGWRLRKMQCACGEVFKRRADYDAHYNEAHKGFRP